MNNLADVMDEDELAEVMGEIEDMKRVEEDELKNCKADADLVLRYTASHSGMGAILIDLRGRLGRCSFPLVIAIADCRSETGKRFSRPVLNVKNLENQQIIIPMKGWLFCEVGAEVGSQNLTFCELIEKYQPSEKSVSLIEKYMERNFGDDFIGGLGE